MRTLRAYVYACREFSERGVRAIVRLLKFVPPRVPLHARTLESSKFNLRRRGALNARNPDYRNKLYFFPPGRDPTYINLAFVAHARRALVCESRYARNKFSRREGGGGEGETRGPMPTYRDRRSRYARREPRASSAPRNLKTRRRAAREATSSPERVRRPPFSRKLVPRARARERASERAYSGAAAPYKISERAEIPERGHCIFME